MILYKLTGEVSLRRGLQFTILTINAEEKPNTYVWKIPGGTRRLNKDKIDEIEASVHSVDSASYFIYVKTEEEIDNTIRIIKQKLINRYKTLEEKVNTIQTLLTKEEVIEKRTLTDYLF